MVVRNRTRFVFLLAMVAFLLLTACSAPATVAPTTAPLPTSVAPSSSTVAPTTVPLPVTSASSPTPQAVSPTQVPLESQVFVAGSGGSLQKAMQDQIIPIFEKQTGVKVTYTAATSGQSLAQTQANPNNPPYDVVWGADQSHLQGKTAKLWQPLDTSVVKNLANVYTEFRDPDNIGVVFGFFTVGIEYNQKIFQDRGFAKPTSWLDLWNPSYKGHVGAYAWTVSFSPSFVVSLSKSLGGSETNTDAAFVKLKSLTPNLINVFPDSGSLDNSLTSGDTWIVYNSSARVLQLSSAGVPVAFVDPKEGAGFVGNTLDIPVNAAHPHAAQAFVNYMLSDEVQQLLPKALGYGPVSKNADVPPDLANLVPSPSDRSHYVFIDWSAIAKRNQELSQLWTQIVETR